MYQRHTRVLILISLALPFFSHGAADDSKGFPPMAVESFSLSPDRIPALRETLRSFAAKEHLTFLEGEMPKQGRQVTQFYLKRGTQPAFYVSNFRDPLKFKATAYSNDPADTWNLSWQRLLIALREVPLRVVAPPPLAQWTTNINDYYPDASIRAKESGEVVVHFSLDATGLVEKPIGIDDEKSTHIPRLRGAAEKIVATYNARFQVGDGYKRVLTASVVFEISPCGNISHSRGADYDLNLCGAPRVMNQDVLAF